MGVSPFIVVSSENSFRIWAWLIVLLLAHRHTLYMHTHTRKHTHTLILLALHGNHHGNKMYRTQSGWDIFKFQRNGNNNRDDKERKRRDWGERGKE